MWNSFTNTGLRLCKLQETEAGDDEGEDEDEDDDEDEDEDDEDEEATDQLDTLKEECQNTPEGKTLVHHLQECSERVLKASQEPGYEEQEHKEDCVEEFFHLQHYLDSCAAPRLFNQLK